MSTYYVEIQKAVNSALEEMAAEHQKGRLINAAASNTHFLVRWVTKSLKSHRFDRCIVPDLTRWQKSGRSKGTGVGLQTTFENISALYNQLVPLDQPVKPVIDKEIDAFLDFMDEQNWSVSTEFELTGKGKVQILTEGDSSLVLCAEQCDSCFDGGEELVKPMSWYVRGNHAEFVRLAVEQGYLVHKVTDYKSIVKYHGEYLVFPNNHANQLAEIPIGFSKKA